MFGQLGLRVGNLRLELFHHAGAGGPADQQQHHVGQDQVQHRLAELVVNRDGFVVTERAINNWDSRSEQQHDQQQVGTHQARDDAKAGWNLFDVGEIDGSTVSEEECERNRGREVDDAFEHVLTTQAPAITRGDLLLQGGGCCGHVCDYSSTN